MTLANRMYADCDHQDCTHSICTKKETQYLIGRSWNKHGVGDYYAGKDEKDGQFMFTCKGKAQAFTNQNTAYGMTLRLKRLLPTPIDGGIFTYSVIEITA